MQDNDELGAFDAQQLALIRQAGLEQTAARFAEDVSVAMATAAKARVSLLQAAPADAAAEPWPSMRMRGSA